MLVVVPPKKWYEAPSLLTQPPVQALLDHSNYVDRQSRSSALLDTRGSDGGGGGGSGNGGNGGGSGGGGGGGEGGGVDGGANTRMLSVSMPTLPSATVGVPMVSSELGPDEMGDPTVQQERRYVNMSGMAIKIPHGPTSPSSPPIATAPAMDDRVSPHSPSSNRASQAMFRLDSPGRDTSSQRDSNDNNNNGRDVRPRRGRENGDDDLCGSFGTSGIGGGGRGDGGGDIQGWDDGGEDDYGLGMMAEGGRGRRWASTAQPRQRQGEAGGTGWSESVRLGTAASPGKRAGPAGRKRGGGRTPDRTPNTVRSNNGGGGKLKLSPSGIKSATGTSSPPRSQTPATSKTGAYLSLSASASSGRYYSPSQEVQRQAMQQERSINVRGQIKVNKVNSVNKVNTVNKVGGINTAVLLGGEQGSGRDGRRDFVTRETRELRRAQGGGGSPGIGQGPMPMVGAERMTAAGLQTCDLWSGISTTGDQQNRRTQAPFAKTTPRMTMSQQLEGASRAAAEHLRMEEGLQQLTPYSNASAPPPRGARLSPKKMLRGSPRGRGACDESHNSDSYENGDDFEMTPQQRAQIDALRRPRTAERSQSSRGGSKGSYYH